MEHNSKITKWWKAKSIAGPSWLFPWKRAGSCSHRFVILDMTNGVVIIKNTGHHVASTRYPTRRDACATQPDGRSREGEAVISEHTPRRHACVHGLVEKQRRNEAFR
jgi:hypothetical protein